MAVTPVGSDTSRAGKCPLNDKMSLVTDGGPPIPVATGIRRGDTSGICRNDVATD
jgi:hypothetical protein